MLDANADSMEFAESLAQQLGSLHSAPHVGHKILDVTRTCHFSLAEIVACLECDPASAIRVLATANAQQPPFPIDSLPIAVNYLGRRTSRQLALSFTFVEYFSKGAGKKFFECYRRKSLLTMAAARRLAIVSGLVEPDRARCAALLLDAGMLYLAHQDPKKYARAFREFGSPTDLLAWEKSRFGMDHQFCGEQIARRLGMPEAVQLAIARHHERSGDGGPMELVLRGASYLADLASPQLTSDGATARGFLDGVFGIRTDGLISLALECQNDGLLEWDRLESELDEDADCEELVESARHLQQLDPSVFVARRNNNENGRAAAEKRSLPINLPFPQVKR